MSKGRAECAEKDAGPHPRFADAVQACLRTPTLPCVSPSAPITSRIIMPWSAYHGCSFCLEPVPVVDAGMGRQATAPPANGEVRQSVKVGKLNLVDLAGSERVHITGATGEHCTLRFCSNSACNLLVLRRYFQIS